LRQNGREASSNPKFSASADSMNEVKNVLCRVDEIPEGGATARDVATSTGGFSIILVRHGDQVRGFVNECPHAGRRLDWAPGKFLFEDGLIVCAAHGAMFRTDTGESQSGICRGSGLRSFPVVVVEGVVGLP
jgi:nitrite reductase/ring-hydroxylating ferredoxin subunit